MADFNTIVSEVFTITNRPDLVKETQLAVKSATLQLHRSEFFYKDILEVALKFDTKDYLQTIDYRALFPRYRALKYLRKFDPSKGSDGVGAFINISTPDEVLDSYGIQKNDICYVAGSVIQLRSSTELEYAIIGIYQNPNVDPANYSSWIADESMYAVVYKAASIVFGTVLGDTARMQTNDAMANVEFQEVRNSNIVAQGY
jgi:hypothetical protein